MKKNTILYVLIVFLLVVNAFFLFNYLGKDSGNKQRMPEENREFIVKELGFNSKQIEQFKNKSEGHHETLMRISDDIKILKDDLFNKITETSVNEVAIDSISSLIGEKESEKEKEIFYHFRMIRNIANDKQKEKFENILMEALRKGERGNRPPPPNGKEGRRPPPRRD